MGVQDDVDNGACQGGDHGELRVAVGADDGVHGLPEHIERDAQGDIEEVFLRVAEGLLIHRAAEHGDDVVCKNEIYRRENKTADDAQHHRIADAALGLVHLASAQRHADEGAAAVAHHDGDGQGHHRQREHHRIGGVAVRSEVTGVGNEDLVNDVVKRAHQQRDDAGDGVLPHELADTLRPQKLIFGIHKNQPSFKK